MAEASVVEEAAVEEADLEVNLFTITFSEK